MSSAFDKILSVLKCFTADKPELRAADIIRMLNIPKPTVYRVLTYLHKKRLLNKDAKTGEYTIGPELYAIGSLYLNKMNIAKSAEIVMKTLHELTNESVFLSILYGTNILLVMKEEYKKEFIWARPVGASIPAHVTAAGIAMLAELSDTTIDSLYPDEELEIVAPKTIATRTELKLELEKVRKIGVSFCREGSIEGIESVASAIKDSNDVGLAALVIGSLLTRGMDDEYRDRLAVLVRSAASLISHQLGYRDNKYQIRDIEELRDWWNKNQANKESKQAALSKTSMQKDERGE